MKELQSAGSKLCHLIEQAKSDKERLTYEVEATVEMLDELRETKGNVKYRLHQLICKINNCSKAQDIDFKRKMEIYNTNMCELYNFFNDKLQNHLIQMEKLESLKHRDRMEKIESKQSRDAQTADPLGLYDEQKAWRENMEEVAGSILLDLDDPFVNED